LVIRQGSGSHLIDSEVTGGTQFSGKLL